MRVEGAVCGEMRALAKRLRDERVELCSMSNVCSYVSLV